MSKHFKNQRNLNRKLFLMQLFLAATVAVICFVLNKRVQGSAFALTALIFAIAHFAAASLVFADRVQAAPIWFGRLLLAVVMKWTIVILLMLIFSRQLKESPLMAILGVMVSLMAVQVFNYLDAKVNRGS